jgi:hypothetical protein
MESVGRSQNGFPRALSPTMAIRPHLNTVELLEGFSLIELSQLVTQVYLPLTAVVSLVVALKALEPVALINAGDVAGISFDY